MASPFSRCSSVESIDDDFELIDMDQETMHHDTEDNQLSHQDVGWTDLEAAKEEVTMEPEQEPIAIASVHLATALSQALAHLAADATKQASPCSPKVSATSCSQPTKLSPQKASRSHMAKESLKAFYLARAKQSEERSKAFRSWTPPPHPTPRAMIQPLKAPGEYLPGIKLMHLELMLRPERYSVAVLDAAKRLENARQAQSALDQFYARRKAEKELRAAWNRYVISMWMAGAT